MATEIVTNYPLPPWPGFYGDMFDQQPLLKRLGAIEERLSRIEQMLEQARGPATE